MDMDTDMDIGPEGTVILYSSVFEPLHIFTIIFLISCLAL